MWFPCAFVRGKLRVPRPNNNGFSERYITDLVLSCKWAQRENLFSLCRAQPKVSKTHFYEGFDFQILQPILLWLSERNKGRLKDWRILQTMVFGICAREALLFVRVHLLTAPINEEMKNLLYSCYKKLKETLCASWAIDYFCSGKPCSAAYGGGL